MIKERNLITINKTDQSKISSVDFNNIPFGRVFSDHMVSIKYTEGQWQSAQILPYQEVKISPACSALHYGQSIFEGMKANLDEQTGDVLLFRPQKNAQRLNASAIRLGMPALPVDLFLDSLYQLVKLDRQWVPTVKDAALYIRPLMFATDPYIGVRASENYRYINFTCPVGAYYSKPVKVLVGDKFVRAIPGGTGDVKAAGNYAGTMHPAILAKKTGYDQVLWTDGYEFKYAQEIGTMNVFFIVDGKALTPELDGAILPGVTRESVIQLLKDKGVSVEERKVSIEELIDAQEKGLLQDAFGTGTAATVTHISDIGYKGKNYQLPPIEARTISNEIKVQLDGIKRGLLPDTYNWIVRL